tara:strand:+ start:1249 stop:2031 length:783 start_codon:yes stop_codon:yes gene_type:complete
MENASEFKDKICLITGGSSGIGRGIALEFGKLGSNVIVADIQENSKIGKYHDTDITTTTTEEIINNGGKSEFIKCDCSEYSDLEKLVSSIEKKYKKIDILINNAGIHIPGSIEEQSIEDWDRVMSINLRSIYALSKLSLKLIKNSTSGRIINIASVNAFRGGLGPAYAPSKSGVLNLTRDMAITLGKYNITVNAICPGYIETPIQDYNTPDSIKEFLSTLPIQRLGKPKDIAHTAKFFASKDSEWITGSYLVVDGGGLAS